MLTSTNRLLGVEIVPFIEFNRVSGHQKRKSMSILKQKFNDSSAMNVRKDALPLKYKLDNWGSLWNGDGSNLVDHSVVEGKLRVFGTGLDEEVLDFTSFQRSLVTDYSSDSSFVSINAVERLP